MENQTRTSATRARLIDGAIAALADRGYHGTTFVEVCRRTGLSRGAIHHHFSAIPDLMLAVVKQLGSDIRHAVTRELAHLPPGTDVLESAIDLIWHQLGQPEFRAIAQLRAAVSTEPSLQPDVRRALARVNGWWHEQTVETVHHADTTLNRRAFQAVLHALAGAAHADLSLGPPPDDPDRVKLRATLKVIARAATGAVPLT